MGRPALWTPDRLTDLRARWEAGEPLPALVQHFGASAAAIKSQAHLHGYVRPERPPRDPRARRPASRAGRRLDASEARAQADTLSALWARLEGSQGRDLTPADVEALLGRARGTLRLRQYQGDRPRPLPRALLDALEALIEAIP
jgi:hypothetical protein